MAITKVRADLIDLNEPNSTKGLKMPSGGAFSGTATEGMLRNDTSQSSQNSASTMQFYNGTDWKNFQNAYVPPVGTENFSPYLYTGAGNVGYTGVGFAPDLVWIKRYDSTGSNYLFDTVRGVYKALISEANYTEINDTQYLTAFDSDGFTLGNNSNLSGTGNDYIAWCWKASSSETSGTGTGGITNVAYRANTDAGFSIVKYTGSGSVGTVTHGLNSKPDLIIFKNRGATGTSDAWPVYSTPTTAEYSLYLNATYAAINDAANFNDTEPTDSVFTVGTWNGINKSGIDFIAYCFHDVAGYQKIGSYTGTGSSGNPQDVGFAPRLVMIKGVDAVSNWIVHSNVTFTGGATGGANHLRWNSGGALDNGANEAISFTSTGFSITTSGATQINTSGEDYLYLAIA